VKTLDAKITEFAPKVGVKRACQAFGVNERTYRHRRQRGEGSLMGVQQAASVRGRLLCRAVGR